MSASQQSQPPTQRRRDPVTTVYTHAQLLSRARELRRHAARTRQRARELRGEILRIQLPVDHSCSARARRLLEKHLSDDLAATLEDAKLIASELVTNAFIHGEGAIELRLSRPPNLLRIEIIDHGRDAEIRVTDDDPNRGYGLRIVDQLADSWGAHQGTTHVWADLRIPGHPIHLAPANRSTSSR
jgi:anti-sigma regulatory factor (Ser/Thr protein kinase)